MTDSLTTTQITLERSLTAWGLGSLAAGSALVLAGKRASRPGWVAAGQQHAGWGAVDAAIGAWGRWRRTRAVPADPAADAERLRRLLLVNSGLDVGYVLAGTALMLAPSQLLRRWPDRVATGASVGAAVVVQGAFLLVLDLTSARRLAAEGAGRGKFSKFLG